MSNLASEKQTDIIIGTETWLESGFKNCELLLDDYDIFRRDRPTRKSRLGNKITRGGGVLIAVKRDLRSQSISISERSETIFCKINLKGNKPLIIGAVYRPPDYTLDESSLVANEIQDIIFRNKNAVFWFGGDFNIPDINWKNQDIPGSQYTLGINSLFLELSQVPRSWSQSNS